jgi:DHA3 family tetracycline resistance protein-like MFS transporter
LSAQKTYLIRSAWEGFSHLGLITFMLYQIRDLGFTPLQLVLAGTALEVSAFLFEVPTGAVADVFSRRLSLIIGYVIMGLGFALMGLSSSFILSFAAQVLWGLGWTFTSGALDAWLVDEVGEDASGHLMLRGSQISQAAALLRIPAALGIAILWGNGAPLILGGGMLIGLGVFLAFAMPETGFKPAPRGERSSFGAALGTFREGLRLVRGSRILMILLAMELIFGLYSEGYDRLWSAHLLENFSLPNLGLYTEVIAFGLLAGVGSLLGIIANEVAKRRLDTTSDSALSRALSGIHVARVILLAVFALTGSLALMLTTMLLFDGLRILNGVLYRAWINKHIDSSVRATVLSMGGQTNAVGQIAGGPPVRWVRPSLSGRRW